MAVTTTYLDPATPDLLALTTGQLLNDTTWDQVLSDLKHLGGVKGTNAVRVSKSVDQSIASGVGTTLTWDTESFDTNNLHSNVSNNSRLTAAEDGIYLVTAVVAWDGTAGTSARQVNLALNGTILEVMGVAHYGVPAFPTGSTVAAILPLTATFFVEVSVQQNLGSAVNVLAAYSRFGMIRLGHT